MTNASFDSISLMPPRQYFFIPLNAVIGRDAVYSNFLVANIRSITWIITRTKWSSDEICTLYNEIQVFSA